MSENNVIEFGYCHCGCGQRTNVSPENSQRSGYAKGEPYQFLRGHSGRRPPKERFWKKVQKGDSPEKCWEWKSCKNPEGYGQFTIDGKKVYAHRYSWELHNGTIPDGLWVLHHCDNPACVNPDHLFVGTQTDNMQDMISKGRSEYLGISGENNHQAHLTTDIVKIIRKRYAFGGITQQKLADRSEEH